MRNKKSKPPVYLVRQGLSLMALADMDLDVIRSIPDGGVVTAEIRQGRNLERHRAYWAYLRECVQATGCADNEQILHKLCKVHNGLFDLVKLPNGEVVKWPSSTAFENLKEEEDFILYFENVKKWLAEEYGFTGEYEYA